MVKTEKIRVRAGLALALLFVAASALAKDQMVRGKKVQWEVAQNSSVMVGQTKLSPGSYEMVCVGPADRCEMTFKKNGKVVASHPCGMKQLSGKNSRTEIETERGADGLQHVRVIRIKGENVEHVLQPAGE
jgi:hypothetical protein